MKLSAFNTAPAETLLPELSSLTCCPPLAAQLVEARPFASAEAALAALTEAFRGLPDDVVLESVNHHPPIGAAVSAGSRSAEEQSQVASTGEEPLERIRQLNPQYQEKFGHVFLICAAGLSGSEIAAALEQRLGQDASAEWAITRAELEAINLRRFSQFLELPAAGERR